MTLRNSDLKNLIYDIFEIDGYKSKMGADKDIVTLSFSLKTKESADDLVSFLEKGYAFVLDADATSGEQSDGTYKVFVEAERSKSVPEEIVEILDGISKLSDISDFKFRYYKNWKSVPATIETLSQSIPLSADDYGITVSESNLNNFKNFFNRSFVESIDMWDDILRIKKAYADPVYFKFLDFGNSTDIKNNIQESLDVNGFSEIIYLSKYIGDYNITKYGNKITMENQDKVLVVERLQT